MRHVLFFLIWYLIFYIVSPFSTSSRKSMSARMRTPVRYGLKAIYEYLITGC